MFPSHSCLQVASTRQSIIMYFPGIHVFGWRVPDHCAFPWHLCLRVASTGLAGISLTFMYSGGEYRTSMHFNDIHVSGWRVPDTIFTLHSSLQGASNRPLCISLTFTSPGGEYSIPDMNASEWSIFNKLIRRHEGHFQEYVKNSKSCLINIFRKRGSVPSKLGNFQQACQTT